MEIGRELSAKEHKVIDISFMKELYGQSNVLTDPTKDKPSSFQSNIIVPIRNAVFLTIGTAYSFSIGANILAYGAHLSDNPYPDCRPEFAKKLEPALSLGDIDAIKSGSTPKLASGVRQSKGSLKMRCSRFPLAYSGLNCTERGAAI